MSTTLGQRFVEAMTARGLSQHGLEQAAKLPKGYVTRIKNGQRQGVNPELLRRSADVLRVDYEWLATGSGTMDGRGTAPQPVSRPERVVERTDEPYPNRRVAVDLLGERVDPRVRQALLDLAFRNMLQDPEVDWWLDKAKELAAKASWVDRNFERVEVDGRTEYRPVTPGAQHERHVATSQTQALLDDEQDETLEQKLARLDRENAERAARIASGEEELPPEPTFEPRAQKTKKRPGARR